MEAKLEEHIFINGKLNNIYKNYGARIILIDKIGSTNCKNTGITSYNALNGVTGKRTVQPLTFINYKKYVSKRQFEYLLEYGWDIWG